jgi:hypothetical protein
VWENKTETYVDDRVLELDMKPVVGDGNEGISCPTQELHSLALQYCEGYLPRVRTTLSPELNIPLILCCSCSCSCRFYDLEKLDQGRKGVLSSHSTRHQLYRKAAFPSLGPKAPKPPSLQRHRSRKSVLWY